MPHFPLMTRSNSTAETSATHSDPRLRDRSYPATAATVAGALRAIAPRLPRWRFISHDISSGAVHLEHDTPIITFTDDITLRLVESNGRTTVSGRSRSRAGSFDFGVNARNLRKILKELDREITS